MMIFDDLCLSLFFLHSKETFANYFFLRNGSSVSHYGAGLYSGELYAQRAEEIIK
jgi:hypothetical protein